MMINAAFAAFGIATGGLHFALLRRNIVIYLRGNGIWRAVAMQAARFSAVAGLFALAAMHGAMPLLSAAIGVLIARHFVVYRMARAP